VYIARKLGEVCQPGAVGVNEIGLLTSIHPSNILERRKQKHENNADAEYLDSST